MKVIKVISLIGGQKTCFDGEYLVDFDAGRDGIDRDGRPMMAWLVTTPSLAGAKQFTDAAEAFELWRSVDPRNPVRSDGKPNRPFTAFTIEVDDAE